MTDESLFNAALALPASERPAFLDAHSPDAAVRKQVEELLAAADASNPLDRRPLDIDRTIHRTQAPPEPTASVGDRIGPYKLLEKIGEGGMGEVWVADQQEPIKRRVAIKLIKPGMDSRSVLGRFEAERQALAVMDHPNIAKVLDAGTTPDGRPYFVMELVKGTPITEFADARKLTTQQRLELFVPVCQAIQHAHLKGIIHRDIKPSNVLVALHDETPVPKVIDFGVAKAVGQQLTEKTIYTGFGALVGTPAYMAPEQATFNQLDVDTRADVYALGVLLYELLAGSPPIEKERLKKAALDEVLRIVREEEPPRPSQRLSTTETRASIAATRGTEPAKLSALMKGELDWIVMKALEKDRTRRYETANGFAADIQRYLSGEPVQAVPPSVSYRLRKAYCRNKAAVRVASAFVCLASGAAAMGAYLAVQAKRAEATAEEKRIEAEANAKQAEANANKAEENADLYMNSVFTIAGAQAEAVVNQRSLQADLDLIELEGNSVTGLLRLAKSFTASRDLSAVELPGADGGTITNTVNLDSMPRYRALREFVTAAVLTTGQNYAPLLPPITHDGQAVTKSEVSPDSRTLLTFGADGTARLWDMRTAKPIAILRQGTERVDNGGFSPDGRTVFTDEADPDIVRFWDAASGRLRAEAKAVRAPGRERRVHQCAISNNRLLVSTSGWAPPAPGDVPVKVESGIELWNTNTGKLVSRLEGPGRDSGWLDFRGDGRWVITREKQSSVLVHSADDGRLVARLSGEGGEAVIGVATSPSARRIALVLFDDRSAVSIRCWDTETWRPQLSCSRIEVRTDSYSKNNDHPLPTPFATEDDIALPEYWGFGEYVSSQIFRLGQTKPHTPVVTVVPPLGDLWNLGEGHVSNAKGVIRPETGRRYATELAQFARDKRFVWVGQWDGDSPKLLDTRVEKMLPTVDKDWQYVGPVGDRTDYWTGIRRGTHDVEIRLMPTGDRLDIPPKLLELWAQVVVRGELGSDGEFVPWNEATWEKKRQELAAVPPPHPDFPFPGHVATDKLHWLRAEFGTARTEAEALRMATELLRRAEEMGNKAESVLWRDEVRKRTREVVPPPRPSK